MGNHWSFGDEGLMRTEAGEISPVPYPGEEMIDEPEEEIDAEPRQTLEATWFVFDSEPDMDDIYEQAGQSLDWLEDELKISPFKTFGTEEKRLFLARFEFPKFGEKFQYPEAGGIENPAGFIDFLTGIPVECIEMLMMIGEYSTPKDVLEGAVQPGDGAAPPVPESFFEWPEADKVLMNFTAIAQRGVDWMAPNLSGEPEPESHYWLRVSLEGGEQKYPVPGEFMGLGVRLMPDKPWGSQDSSPFLYSGNWMDMVYLTSAVITEVIEPTDEVPYPTYKAQWRGLEGALVTVRPSDFAEYRVGDRVTVLKDVAAEKTSQLWRDSDMKEFGENWMIAPITFYGLEGE